MSGRRFSTCTFWAVTLKMGNVTANNRITMKAKT
jgi:hypothetical protein